MCKIITAFLFLALLSGCAVQQDVHPLTSRTTFFALDEQEVFSIGGDLSAEKHIFLAVGVYKAAHESIQGIYYEGPTNAVRIEGGDITMIAQGGIYLSKKSDEPAKTWVYSESLERYIKGDPRKSSLAEVTKGSVNEEDIVLHWDIPDAIKAKIQLEETL